MGIDLFSCMSVGHVINSVYSASYISLKSYIGRYPVQANYTFFKFESNICIRKLFRLCV